MKRYQNAFAVSETRCPCLANESADENAGGHDGGAPHDHHGNQNRSHEFEIVMLGEESTVLVEDEEFNHDDAERVLDDECVLDLHELDKVGDADYFDMAAHAVLDEQRTTDVQTDLEKLQSLD